MLQFRLPTPFPTYTHRSFDRILDKYGIQKVEVLGDAFFVVGGCPVPSTDHAERCVNAALEMQAHMPILRAFAGGADISMRVGVHTGPVIAGVVGSKDPRYHLFGATVPAANAMESHGEPGRVHISWETYNRLQVNQEARARVFVDSVRDMFRDEPPHGGGGGDGLLPVGIEPVITTETPSSHSISAYPRIAFSKIDALLRDVAAAETAAAAAGAHGPTNVAGSEVDGAFASGAPPTVRQATDSRDGGVSGSTRGVELSDRVATVTSAEQLTDDAPNSADGEGVTVVPEEGEGALRGQVQLWRRGAFLGWDIRTNLVQNDFIYSRTDLPLMLAMAPLLPAQPAPQPSAPTLSAAPFGGTHMRRSSSVAPSMSESLSVEDHGHTAFGLTTSGASGGGSSTLGSGDGHRHGDAGHTLEPRKSFIASAGGTGLVRMLSRAASFVGWRQLARQQPHAGSAQAGDSFVFSQRSLAAPDLSGAPSGLRMTPPDQVSSAESGGGGAVYNAADSLPNGHPATAPGSSDVRPGDAARRAFRSRHALTTITSLDVGSPAHSSTSNAAGGAGAGGANAPNAPTAAGSAGTGHFLSARGLLNRGGTGGTSMMMSSRVLMRTVSTIEKAAVGLAGKLDYARSGIYRAVLARLRARHKADAPLSAAADKRPALGPYKPDDPLGIFGPGAGFFAFEERSGEANGLGKPTFFVARADPPLLPELAKAIKRLEEYVEGNLSS